MRSRLLLVNWLMRNVSFQLSSQLSPFGLLCAQLKHRFITKRRLLLIAIRGAAPFWDALTTVISLVARFI